MINWRYFIIEVGSEQIFCKNLLVCGVDGYDFFPGMAIATKPTPVVNLLNGITSAAATPPCWTAVVVVVERRRKRRLSFRLWWTEGGVW